VPQLDEIDAAPEKREVTLILTNRLRPAGASHSSLPAGDLLWVKLTDSYALRQNAQPMPPRRAATGSEPEPFSDLRIQVEARPLPTVALAAESFVNLYGRGVVVMNSELRARPWDWLVVTAGQRYTRHGIVPQRGDLFSPESLGEVDPIGGRERVAAVQWGAQLSLPWRLALATKTLLDLEHSQFTEMSYGIRWRGACNECWAITLVYQQFPEKEQVSFLITLRGMGGSESKGVKGLFLQ
jgi:hypothetical protein